MIFSEFLLILFDFYNEKLKTDNYVIRYLFESTFFFVSPIFRDLSNGGRIIA